MSTRIDRLSIVIVTWQGDDLLRTSLDSLARVYGTRPEIVVVDNADQASTRALVSAYAHARYVPALDLRAAGRGSAKTRSPSEVVCGE